MFLTKNALTLVIAFSLYCFYASANLEDIKSPDGRTIWELAPDFRNDPIQPYPDLKGPDGKNLTTENIRGVHLFGYKGCTNREANAINYAYNDFYKLAQQPDLYNHINWNDEVIKDFFGPNSPGYKIPDDTRAEIQQIFAAAQQVYNYPWTWVPPWLAWRQLWIEVRCSGNDGKGDPDDKCGDRSQNGPPQCPPKDPRVPGDNEDDRLEAFSEPNARYSRITFCSKFFDLPTLSEVVKWNKRKPKEYQDDLDNWNNRARVFFHEVTHLDFFMNANDNDKNSKSPEVFDAQFKYKIGKKTFFAEAYGPYYAKILRNYIPSQKKYIGYYTQRNAENYAYAALAKYVEKQIRRYPSKPDPGNRKPDGPPRKSPSGDPLSKPGMDPADPGDSAKVALIGGKGDPYNKLDVHIPGCGDKYTIEKSKDDSSDESEDDLPKSPTKPKPKRWSYKHGGASRGQWALHIQPHRDSEKDAELRTWIQDGRKSKRFGPLKIDCDIDNDEFQGFAPEDTGLKHYLLIKSGHACAEYAEDFNLDWTAVKYSHIIDLPVSSDGRCFDTDGGGASCVIDMEPSRE